MNECRTKTSLECQRKRESPAAPSLFFFLHLYEVISIFVSQRETKRLFNSWFIEKDPDARKVWRQKEKRATGWDTWMASPIQWTWTWANSRGLWGIGRPGVLQSMGSQLDMTWWLIKPTTPRVHTRIQEIQSLLPCQVGSPIGTYLGTLHTTNSQVFIKSLHVVGTGVPILILIAPW